MANPWLNSRHCPLRRVGGDVLLVDRGNFQVGHGDKNHIGSPHGLGGGENLETVLLGHRNRFAAPVESDGHPDPAVFQIEGVGVALGAEADDGDFASA